MRTLKAGMRGPDVTAWQKFLQGQDFDPGNMDGSFGQRTALATQEFQTRQGLTADGAAGKDTLGQSGRAGLSNRRPK